jgi:hypothetical protein
MNILEKLNLKEMPLWRLVVLGLGGLIVLAIVLSLAKTAMFSLGLRGVSRVANDSVMSFSAPGAPSMGYGGANKGLDLGMAEEMALSSRNVAGIVPDYDGSTGDTAESLEVTEYNASIETRALKQTCAAIAGLKPLDYVIFENANESEKYCNYYFKVKTDKKDEILMKIRDLDPKELTENIHTIKKRIDDYTSQEEILKKQLASVEETLGNALSDYDQLRQLATQARDVESLAKIIDSKISLIERLTQQRININSQLDRLARSKADELDKVEYTFFRVYAYENKFVDWQDIRDSWKQAVKAFVLNLNKILQDISINLVTVIFTVVQWAIYLIIILVAGKILWKLGKRIWAKEPPKV